MALMHNPRMYDDAARKRIFNYWIYAHAQLFQRLVQYLLVFTLHTPLVLILHTLTWYILTYPCKPVGFSLVTLHDNVLKNT